MAVWLQAKVCLSGLRRRLNAGPVCDAQRRGGGMCGFWRYISAEHLLFLSRQLRCGNSVVFSAAKIILCPSVRPSLRWSLTLRVLD